MRPISTPIRSERGMTLVELMIALVVLAVGVLTLARLFPSASSTQLRGRMMTAGNYYAREKLEELSALAWADTALNAGRHPSATGVEALGTGGAWKRYYNVTVMAAPLAELKSVTITVRWSTTKTESTTTTTYLRK
jgi:type IV pilus assembly protein PilV